MPKSGTFDAAVAAAAILLLGVAREVSLRWRHRAVAQQLKAAQTRIAELEAAQGTVALPAVSSAGSLSEKPVMGPAEAAAASPVPATGDGPPDAKR